MKTNNLRSYTVLLMSLILLVAGLGTFTSDAQDIIRDNPLCPVDEGELNLPAPPVPGEYFGFTQGHATSFFPEPLTTLYAPYVYGVEVNKPVTATYYIEYIGGLAEPADADLPVRFYALLNEQFIPLGEDGTLYRDGVLPWQSRFDLTIEIDPLEAGIYDLVVIAVVTPNTPIQEVMGMDFLTTAMSGRMTLIAGEMPETVTDDRNYTEMPEGILPAGMMAQYSEESIYPSMVMTLANQYGPWAIPDLQLTLPAGSSYDFTVNLGQTQYFIDYNFDTFAQPDYIPYALILFEDYEPVSITGDPDELVFYGAIMADDVLVQHNVTLNAPESGTRDLVAVRIDHPGKPMCQIISGTNSGVYGIRVVVGAEE